MSFNDVVKTLSIGANIAENVTPNGKRATSGGDYDRRCKDKREKCRHAKASYVIPLFYLRRKRRKIYTRGEIDRSLNSRSVVRNETAILLTATQIYRI